MTEPVDLAAILEEAGEPRTARLELARMDLRRLGIGELLEISRAVELAPGELGAALRSEDAVLKSRVALAIAWIIARRREPALTYAEVQTWRIEIIGSPPATEDPTPPLEPSSSSGPESPGWSE